MSEAEVWVQLAAAALSNLAGKPLTMADSTAADYADRYLEEFRKRYERDIPAEVAHSNYRSQPVTVWKRTAKKSSTGGLCAGL